MKFSCPAVASHLNSLAPARLALTGCAAARSNLLPPVGGLLRVDFRFLCGFLVVFFLLLQMPLFSSEKRVNPTFTKETRVQVARGEAVEISLEAITDYGNMIAFQIQDPPQHGSLSLVTNTSDHTAKVIYHHDGSRMPLKDEFSFRAQAPGCAKSPATQVSIEIIPPPAFLVFDPKELNFGSLLLTEKRQSNVVIRNIGGSKAVGRLVLPGGFAAPKGDGYSLEEGGSVSLVVEFHPQEERNFLAEGNTLPFQEREPLRLSGAGLPRFELGKPDPLTCLVKNLSDQPLRLSFIGDVCWIMPQETVLPPRSEKSFLFQQAETGEETHYVALSSIVHVSDGLSVRDFELPPPREFIPLMVRAVTEQPLGTMPLGAFLPVKFSLLNRSEFPKKVIWTASSASGGGSQETPLELTGGEAREIGFNWKPELPGAAQLKIVIREGVKTSHELLWNAMMTTTSSGVVSSQEVEEPAPATGDAPGEPAPQANSPENFATSKSIPSLGGASWKTATSWLGKRTLLLLWDAEPSNDSRITIEERVMRKSEQVLASGSLPFKVESFPVEVTREKKEENQIVVSAPKISPRWHLILLSRVSKAGVIQEQSLLQVYLPPNASLWSIWRMPLGSLVILLLIALMGKLRGSF